MWKHFAVRPNIQGDSESGEMALCENLRQIAIQIKAGFSFVAKHSLAVRSMKRKTMGTKQPHAHCTPPLVFGSEDRGDCKHAFFLRVGAFVAKTLKRYQYNVPCQEQRS